MHNKKSYADEIGVIFTSVTLPGDMSEQVLMVPDNMAGLIIGPDWKQITSLETESGCTIDASARSGCLTHWVFTILGTEIEISLSLEKICNIIFDGNSMCKVKTSFQNRKGLHGVVGGAVQNKDDGGMVGELAREIVSNWKSQQSGVRNATSLTGSSETLVMRSRKLKHSNTTKRTKEEIKTMQKKARKTLQDDQREVMKNFHEKIVSVGLGYQCKSCPFATALELKAKTHAQTCGKPKRMKRRKKEIKCAECDVKFQ